MRLLTYNLIEIDDNGLVHSTTDIIPLAEEADTQVTFSYKPSDHELHVQICSVQASN